MKQIQASDAKARFAEILDQRTRGDGDHHPARSVGRTAGPVADERQAEINAAIDEIKRLRKQNGKVTVEELLSARHEGHNY